MLGHPSFPCLKLIFPIPFKDKKIVDFQFETCELSNHHHTFFPLQVYEKSNLFVFIHSDSWGSSHMKILTRIRWLITFMDDHSRVCYLSSKTMKNLQNFHKMINTQFQSHIHILTKDNRK